MATAKENSVRQLCELYNVVIGVALSLAIYNTTDVGGTDFPLKLDIVINFLTMLVLIVPFYHGAVRHLFATYVEKGGSTQIKSGALLADFFLLFMEGCLFVMMATVISDTIKLAYVVIVLLLLDSVWGFLAWLAFTGAKSQFAEKTWAAINIVASGILIIGTFFAEVLISNSNLKLQVSLFVVVAIRTVADYGLTWKFYFPSGDE